MSTQGKKEKRFAMKGPPGIAGRPFIVINNEQPLEIDDDLFLIVVLGAAGYFANAPGPPVSYTHLTLPTIA